MTEMTDIQDPLVRPKKSLGARLGLGAAGLVGSFVMQVMMAGLLMFFAPFCSFHPPEEEEGDIIEMAVVNEPEPEPEKEEEPEPEVEEEAEEPEPEPEPKPEPEKTIEPVEKPEPNPELEEVETEEEVVEEEAPPELLEGLTMESTADGGDFAVKVGKGISSGKMNDKYVDPKNLDKIKTKEGATGSGFIKKKPPKQCKPKKATVKKRTRGVYPLEAQRRRLEGAVTAVVTVTASGKVTKVRVVKNAGHGFDESATAAFKKWSFSPAEKDCEKVESEVRVTHTFTLE